jgi:hypothetical protein
MVKRNMSDLEACIHNRKAMVASLNNIGILGILFPRINFENYAMELDSDRVRW